MPEHSRRLFPFAALVGLLAAQTLPAQTRLLRFPDLHGEQVVFTYGGDLWRAPLAGGTATRLTSSRGVVGTKRSSCSLRRPC